jgi:hypothetical protein
MLPARVVIDPHQGAELFSQFEVGATNSTLGSWRPAEPQEEFALGRRPGKRHEDDQADGRDNDMYIDPAYTIVMCAVSLPPAWWWRN